MNSPEQKLKPLLITPDLKAITIHGPWAWAIVSGFKKVENRSWLTNHRGRLAICAGKSPNSDIPALQAFKTLGINPPDRFERGMIVGTVDLVAILTLEDYLKRYGTDDRNRTFALGPFCWVLENPVPCIPLRCPGNFQIWNVQSQLARYKKM